MGTSTQVSDYRTNPELRIFLSTSEIELPLKMPANLSFDLTFPHSYTVAPTELSRCGERPPIYFPGSTRTGGKDGLLLRFTASNGNQWDGCFAFGDYGLCGVFAFPDPDCVCVVSDGTGYWVHVNEPEKSSELGVFPIRDIRSIPDARILLLADFTSLYAFGSDGQHWKQRVCWDGLNISDIREGIVSGTGHDPTNSKQSTSKFAVALATGRILQSAWS